MKQIIMLDTFTKDGFYLTQEYGTNKYIDYTKYNLLYHEGVDFGHFNKRAPIRACHSGTCLTGYHSAYGKYVLVLDYSQLCATWYCHLSRANIQNGQEIKAGEVVGNMGNSGNSTASHLHFMFVIIDDSGVRLHQNKFCNWGYLDPLHPLDPSQPKKHNIAYNINWTESEESMNDDCQKIYEHFGVKDFEELKAWKERETGYLEDERAKVKFLESKIKVLEIQKNGLETQISGLKAENSELSSQVGLIRNDLTHEKEKNDVLSQKVMILTEENGKLNTKITKLKADKLAGVSFLDFIQFKLFGK